MIVCPTPAEATYLPFIVVKYYDMVFDRRYTQKKAKWQFTSRLGYSKTTKVAQALTLSPLMNEMSTPPICRKGLEIA